MTRVSVITVSDSRSIGTAEDRSGPAVEAALSPLGLEVSTRLIVPDDVGQIQAAVHAYLGDAALIVTTGGTGISDRDVTPEALEPLFDRRLPGFGEIMRTGSYSKTPLSIISRGGAGVIGRTLVVMLPGSPGGVAECLALIGPAIKHVLKVLDRQKVDCQSEREADVGSSGTTP